MKLPKLIQQMWNGKVFALLVRAANKVKTSMFFYCITRNEIDFKCAASHIFTYFWWKYKLIMLFHKAVWSYQNIRTSDPLMLTASLLRIQSLFVHTWEKRTFNAALCARTKFKVEWCPNWPQREKQANDEHPQGRPLNTFFCVFVM